MSNTEIYTYGTTLALYDSLQILALAMVRVGMGLTGLVTALGGLFAVDIAPKRVAGAAMGVIGIFSYIGAGIQEQVSGALIQAGMRMVDGVRVYDFGTAIWFWIGSWVMSRLLAASLWRTRLRDYIRCIGAARAECFTGPYGYDAPPGSGRGRGGRERY